MIIQRHKSKDGYKIQNLKNHSLSVLMKRHNNLFTIDLWFDSTLNTRYKLYTHIIVFGGKQELQAGDRTCNQTLAPTQSHNLQFYISDFLLHDA